MRIIRNLFNLNYWFSVMKCLLPYSKVSHDILTSSVLGNLNNQIFFYTNPIDIKSFFRITLKENFLHLFRLLSC